MSEKYTIKETVIGARFYIFKNEIELGYLKDEKEAQDYIAWKNQPKIDKDFKQQMLNHFNSLQTKDSNNWMYGQYAILIKHLESLPTGEN